MALREVPGSLMVFSRRRGTEADSDGRRKVGYVSPCSVANQASQFAAAPGDAVSFICQTPERTDVFAGTEMVTLICFRLLWAASGAVAEVMVIVMRPIVNGDPGAPGGTGPVVVVPGSEMHSAHDIIAAEQRLRFAVHRDLPVRIKLVIEQENRLRRAIGFEADAFRFVMGIGDDARLFGG